MIELEKYYPSGTIPQEILSMLSLTHNPLRLEEIWALMDLAWAITKADPEAPQILERVHAYQKTSCFFSEHCLVILPGKGFSLTSLK